MALKFFKVTNLPGELEADSFYYVANDDFAESYLTDSEGVAKAIGNSAMIEDIAEEVVNDAIAAFNSVQIVADITARNALDPESNIMVLVLDASTDETVTAGAALYVYDLSNTTWIKVAEYESMDVAVDWSAISNGPASSTSAIDDAVSASHSHSNKTELDKIGESGGVMTYNGSPIGGEIGWEDLDW